ncbi:MAG: bifunctional UDP-sugar hydrolase/5'-nucleotidase [Planctomycetota bacterium]
MSPAAKGPLRRARPLLLPATALVLVATARAQAGPDPWEVAAGTDLVVVHCNDFHGQVQPLAGKGGYLAMHEALRRLEASARAAGAELWLTNGGDWFQGTPEGNESRGALTVDLFERLGMDLSVLGNHEFDFGDVNARALVDRARHPVLAANLHVEGRHDPAPWVRPYVVRAVRGLRIGVLGLVTSSTPQTSTGPFGPQGFADELETMTAWRPRLAAACDAWILLTHCGVDVDRALARRFPATTLVLGGHSHTDLRAPLREGRTWIVQTGGKARALYVVELRVDPLMREVRVARARHVGLGDVDPARADAGERAWLDRATADLRAHWDVPLGRLEGEWGRPYGFGSSAAGNLVAELIREEAGAEVGVQNKGGLRSLLRPGPFTLRQAFELCPFENTVVSMVLRGDELRAVLGQILVRAGRPPEVAGLRYEVLRGDGLRVGRMWRADHSLVGSDQELKVATNSFLAAGGDGAEGFTRGRSMEHHAVLLRDLVVRKLRSQGVLRADPEDRILVVGEKAVSDRNPDGKRP